MFSEILSTAGTNLFGLEPFFNAGSVEKMLAEKFHQLMLVILFFIIGLLLFFFNLFCLNLPFHL